jgi:hypothetical protein
MPDDWGRSLYQCQNQSCNAKANLTVGEVLDWTIRHQKEHPEAKHLPKCLDKDADNPLDDLAPSH